jgi:hypothetical protein
MGKHDAWFAEIDRDESLATHNRPCLRGSTATFDLFPLMIEVGYRHVSRRRLSRDYPQTLVPRPLREFRSEILVHGERWRAALKKN